jgi:transposase
MRQKSVHPESSSERIVKTIPRATRKRHSSEEKIQIVLDGLRGESSIAELCRREGIAEGLYYTWSKEFLEAGKGGCARSPSLHLYGSRSFRRTYRCRVRLHGLRGDPLDQDACSGENIEGYDRGNHRLAHVGTAQDPETRQKLIAQGLSPLVTCGADFGALIRKQYDEYGRIIRETEIKAD